MSLHAKPFISVALLHYFETPPPITPWGRFFFFFFFRGGVWLSGLKCFLWLGKQWLKHQHQQSDVSTEQKRENVNETTIFLPYAPEKVPKTQCSCCKGSCAHAAEDLPSGLFGFSLQVVFEGWSADIGHIAKHSMGLLQPLTHHTGKQMKSKSKNAPIQPIPKLPKGNVIMNKEQILCLTKINCLGQKVFLLIVWVPGG